MRPPDRRSRRHERRIATTSPMSVQACGRRQRGRRRRRQAARMPNADLPRSRITGPATRAGRTPLGISDRHLRHPEVDRLSRDTYLPACVAGDLRQPTRRSPAHCAARRRRQPPDGGGALGPGDPARDRDDDGSISRSPADSRAREPGGPPPTTACPSARTRSLGTSPCRSRRRRARGATSPGSCNRRLSWRPPTRSLAGGCASRRDSRSSSARRPRGRGCAQSADGPPDRRPRAGSPDGVGAPLAHPRRRRCRRRTSSTPSGRRRPVSRTPTSPGPSTRSSSSSTATCTGIGGSSSNDLRRQNALVAAGWTVLRFTLRGRAGAAAQRCWPPSGAHLASD